MKAAISTDAGSVSAHFGRCPDFTIVDIENGKILYKEVVENPGHQPVSSRSSYTKGVLTALWLEGWEGVPPRFLTSSAYGPLLVSAAASTA